MRKDIPKRIAIIGVPGSGKSTFATKLGKALNVPVHHLDGLMFDRDGKKKDRQELVAIETAMVSHESWIVEGCAIATLETRFARADQVIYFQFPRHVCIWRVFKRLFSYNRALAETGCARRVNWRLLKYIWSFEREKSPAVNELRKRYPKVEFLLLRNPGEVEQFLTKLTCRRPAHA